jgi:hypothetical protein
LRAYFASNGTGNIQHKFRDYETATFWCRFYLYVHTAPAAQTVIWKYGDGLYNPILVKLNTTRKVSIWDDAGVIGAESGALTVDTWYRIEVSYNDTTNVTTLWVDGTQIATGGSSTVDGGDRFYLGSMTSTTCDIFFDDVAVNDATAGGTQTGLPGAGGVVVLKPAGAGSSAATAGDYADINEVPPSDTGSSPGVGIIELDANPTTGFYTVDDPVTAGIASGSTINSILLLARMREETAGTSNWFGLIKSASGGTEETTASDDAGDATTVRTNPAATTAFSRNLYSYIDATTAAAWTVTGTNSLTNMQIGVRTTDGTPDTWCYTLAAMVDYTPAAGTNVTVTVSAPEAFVATTLTPTITAGDIRINATLQSFISATLTAVVTATRNISIAMAILTSSFTTLAPTVTAETSISNSPPIESATFVTITPTVSTTRNINNAIAIQSGVLATIQPSLTLNDNEEIAAGINSGVLATLDPIIVAERCASVSATLQSYTSDTLNPAISTTRNVSVSPTINSGVFAQFASTTSITRNVSNSPTIQSGTFSTLDPTITTTSAVNIEINADLQSGAFATIQPSITNNDNETIAPGIQSATFSTLDPVVSTTRNVNQAVAIQSGEFATLTPAVSTSINISSSPTIESGEFATLTPVITTTRSVSISPDIQSGVWELITPTIESGGNISISPAIESGTFSQPEAVISTTRNVSISPAIDSGEFLTLTPAIVEGQGITVSPIAESALFATINPAISTEQNISITSDVLSGSLSTLTPTIETPSSQTDITIYAPVQYIGAIKKIFIVNRGKMAIYLGGTNYLEL